MRPSVARPAIAKSLERDGFRLKQWGFNLKAESPSIILTRAENTGQQLLGVLFG
jgi:hypothetical protein